MVKGTVEKVYTKDWAGRDGAIVLHSFQLQGDSRYFRTGTDKLVSQGDCVTFDIEGANQLIPTSLTKTTEQVVTGAAGVRTPARAWGGAAKKSENFEARQTYWENKEARDIEVVEPRITWSSSRTAAIEVVGLALQHDALAFGNASKGAKLGMILDYVDEVSARFYAQSMRASETAEELTHATSGRADDVSKTTKKKGAEARDPSDDQD